MNIRRKAILSLKKLLKCKKKRIEKSLMYLIGEKSQNANIYNNDTKNNHTETTTPFFNNQERRDNKLQCIEKLKNLINKTKNNNVIKKKSIKIKYKLLIRNCKRITQWTNELGSGLLPIININLHSIYEDLSYDLYKCRLERVQTLQSIFNIKISSIINNNNYKKFILSNMMRQEVISTKKNKKISKDNNLGEIVNITLPQNTNNYINNRYKISSQHIAAGLGYIILFLKLFTKYIRVPLPFNIEYFGSLSTICRQNSLQKHAVYNNINNNQNSIQNQNIQNKPITLCPKTSTKSEFKKGLSMLKRNIIHVCFQQGIGYHYLYHINNIANNNSNTNIIKYNTIQNTIFKHLHMLINSPYIGLPAYKYAAIHASNDNNIIQNQEINDIIDNYNNYDNNGDDNDEINEDEWDMIDRNYYEIQGV